MKESHRIAVVEDDPAIGPMLSKILEMEGFDVTVISDGRSALSALSTGRYDAAVLDVMLPGMDGITILRQIRPGNQQLPILVLTAKTDNVTTWEGWRAGANYLMNKPFDPEELVRILRSMIS